MRYTCTRRKVSSGGAGGVGGGESRGGELAHAEPEETYTTNTASCLEPRGLSTTLSHPRESRRSQEKKDEEGEEERRRRTHSRPCSTGSMDTPCSGSQFDGHSPVSSDTFSPAVTPRVARYALEATSTVIHIGDKKHREDRGHTLGAASMSPSDKVQPGLCVSRVPGMLCEC